ncbi:MAG TPA: hypothetical protein VEL76_13765 [Gemmataceae bacterium]|nr:hypothetical protein [Gemmataceae bacterium]
MAEPAARRMPWGLVLTIVLLSLLLGMVFRAAPWRVVLATVGMAVGTFLALRRLQNYLWGVVGALVLALHPLNWEWSAPFEQSMRAEALELIVLAAVVTAWELAARPAFAGVAWLLVALALCLGGGLAWPALPQAGLVTALLTVVGLPLGGLLAALRHRERPAWGNVTAAVVLGIAAPILGLLLAAASVRVLDWPVSGGVGADSGAFDFLSAAVGTGAAGLEIGSFAANELHRWAWPAVWVVLPFLLVGLWLTVRRGSKLLSARRPPLPWVLTLYALVELVGAALHPSAALTPILLRFASVALLLAIFGIAEIVRAVLRPLVLPPPEERMLEEAEQRR